MRSILLLSILIVFGGLFVAILAGGDDDHGDEDVDESENKTGIVEAAHIGHGSKNSTDPKFPPEGYDNRESGIHGAPQHINVTVYVEAIVSIDVSRMEYVLHGYVIQEWHDARLNGVLSHPILLSKSAAASVWLPDIFCLSCRESTLNSPDYTNVLIKVSQNGDIYYSQLAKLHSSCYMKLHDFPFDKQVCPLKLSSYGYNTEYLVYHWKNTPVVDKMQLEQFTVSEKVTPTLEWGSYPAGNFTILSFELFFERQIGFYILQVYLPCAILVMLSWMTFFMEAADIGDRLSIGVTLILTMIFLLGYINQSLPKVSYIKAVDWYVIASLFMIVASVLESVFVYWLLHRKIRKEDKKDSFDKFDRYIDKMLSESSMTSFIPLLSNNGVSLPSLPGVGQNPFRTTFPVNDVEKQSSPTKCRKASFDVDDENEDVPLNIMNDENQNGETRRRHNKKKDGSSPTLPDKATNGENEEKLQNMDKIVTTDICARIIFPLSYVIFTIGYICYYGLRLS